MANLNETPSSERVHISFFGKRNVGKSSVVNRVAGQDLSIVSDVKGTTTDPVYKSMEILPIGPVEIIDTPGIDDEGELGELRVSKTLKVLHKTDVAILVVDINEGIKEADTELIKEFKKMDIKYIVVYNKMDIYKGNIELKENEIAVSALQNKNIDALIEKISKLKVSGFDNVKLVGDYVKKDDIIVLVMPQDGSAPKGRIILPQVEMIRDLLDNHCITISVQTEELKQAIDSLNKKPAFVITDSQVFKEVDSILDKDINLTSFSILLAKYKGLLDSAVRGVVHVNDIKKGDKVLIAEGCTHHRQCEDIGTVKIPALLKKKLGFDVDFDTASGHNMPDDIEKYKMIIHCGGCMLNEREVKYRVNTAGEKNIPITNYGILIAYLQGILKRSLFLFEDLQKLID